MKRILLLLVISMTGNFIFAQDIIIKRDGDEIVSKVLEITIETIKYKGFENPEGPIRNILISDVFMIIYENGKREKFTVDKNKGNPNEIDSSSKAEPQKTVSAESPKKAYNGDYFVLGTGIGTSYGGIGVQAQWIKGGINSYGVHAGVGLIPDGGIMASAGIKYFPYKNLYIDTQFGITDYEDEYYYDYDGKALYGPSFMFGGNWTWGNKIGFGFNAGIGLSYNINAEYKDYFTGAIDMGFIVRF